MENEFRKDKLPKLLWQ